MVDYRDEMAPGRKRNYIDEHESGMGGALIALLFVLLALVAIFWYASSSTPDNGTAAPVIESNEGTPVAPSAPATPAQ